MIVRWMFVALVSAALGVGNAEAGKVLYVDDDGQDGFNCAGAPYSRITDALAAAVDGDEIRVCPGTYPEQVVITRSINLVGENFGARRAVIKPNLVPATLGALDSGNPIAAAVLVSSRVFRMTDVDVDLADASVSACSPALAGLYLRNVTGRLERVKVFNALLPLRPDCESGVGIFIESGPIDFVLGEPVYGRARMSLRSVTVEGYQKAGIIGLGPQTVIKILNSHTVYEGAAAAAAVPNGFEVSFGARAKIVSSTAQGNKSLTVGKLGSGILAYEPGKTKYRLLTITNNQVGVFVVGDRARIKRSILLDQTSDGVVLLGDANIVSSTEIQHSSVSGCFVNGDRNVIRGGYINDTPFGIWFIAGFGNAYFATKFENVDLAVRGNPGGVRDLTPDAAAPFRTMCVSALACDDGNACTVDICTVATGQCSHAPTVCNDANECTLDTCDPTIGCQATPVTDGTPCTGGTCTAGVCQP